MLAIKLCECGCGFVEYSANYKAWMCQNCGAVRATEEHFNMVREVDDEFCAVREADDNPDTNENRQFAVFSRHKCCATYDLVRSIHDRIFSQHPDCPVTRVRLLAEECSVKDGMRLASSPDKLDPRLGDFFRNLDSLRKYGWEYNLNQIAEALDHIGVSSAAGHKPTNSHVSNCIRKAVLQVGPAYEKKNYKHKNWRSFARSAK